jgi:hypothetical protein
MGDFEVALLLFSSLVLFFVSASLLLAIGFYCNCRAMADRQRLHEEQIADFRSQIEHGKAMLAEQITTQLAVSGELKTRNLELAEANEAAVRVAAQSAKQKKRLKKRLNRTQYALEVESSIVVKQKGFIDKLIEKVAVAEGGLTEATELKDHWESQANKSRAKNNKLETERMEERSREVGSKIVETVVSHGVGSVI